MQTFRGAVFIVVPLWYRQMSLFAANHLTEAKSAQHRPTAMGNWRETFTERRPGESTILELPTVELIEVTMLGIKGNQVRIGTAAPDDISIVREELLAKA